MIKLQGQTDKRSEDFYGGTDPDPPRDNYWVMRDAATIKLQYNYSTQCPADTPHSKLRWMRSLRSMGFKFQCFKFCLCKHCQFCNCVIS